VNPAFLSKVEDTAIHETGFFPLDEEWEISIYPVWDPVNKLAARNGGGDALKVCERLGGQLPSVEQYEMMHKLGYHIEPYALPTSAMQNAMLASQGLAGVSYKDPRVLQAIVSYRENNMMTHAWCVFHDTEVMSRIAEYLKSKGLKVADKPFDNFGKHWAMPRADTPKLHSLIFGWWTPHARSYGVSNDVIIQNPSTWHDDKYDDYGTTYHMVRRRTSFFKPIVDTFKKVFGFLGSLVPSSAPAPVATPPKVATPAKPATVAVFKPDFPTLIPTFVPAKYFRAWVGVQGRIITHVIIHTAECSESPTGAEAVASFFKMGPPSPASAHFCVDNNSTVQCVRIADVAFAAPPLNDKGVHIELAGVARQTLAEWNDPYSRDELARCAILVAEICKKYNIPVVYVDATGLKANQWGITTHMQVSNAFHQSNHQDPGVNFPMNEFLAMVQAHM
jgi:hypothetical protein